MPHMTAQTTQEDIIGCKISQEQRGKISILTYMGGGGRGSRGRVGWEIRSVGHVTYS